MGSRTGEKRRGETWQNKVEEKEMEWNGRRKGEQGEEKKKKKQ